MDMHFLALLEEIERIVFFKSEGFYLGAVAEKYGLKELEKPLEFLKSHLRTIINIAKKMDRLVNVIFNETVNVIQEIRSELIRPVFILNIPDFRPFVEKWNRIIEELKEAVGHVSENLTQKLEECKI